MVPIFSAVAALALLPAAPQGESDDSAIVARFVAAGRPAVVTRADLALELAERFAHTEEGKQALDHLIDRTIVETEAHAAGLVPDRAAVGARIAHYERELADRGVDLAEFLADRHLSREVFADQIAVSMMHERLVLRELGLESAERLETKHLELWLREARAKRSIVSASSELPRGAVATVDGRPLTRLQLGTVLWQTASPERREKFTRQVVARALLAAEAERLGIEVTAADRDAEVARRERDLGADPRYGGLTYEQILATQGTTKERLARSPVLIAQIQQRRIAEHRHDDAALRRRLAAERDEIERRHGQRRHLEVIFVRANDGSLPADLVRRDFDEAEAEVHRAIQRIADGMSFADAARIHSEHAETKLGGGAVGMVAQADAALPREVMDAAFALPPLQLSAPIRSAEGVWLVRTSRLGRPPTDDELICSLRDELADRLLQDLLAGCELELVR